MQRRDILVRTIASLAVIGALAGAGCTTTVTPSNETANTASRHRQINSSVDATLDRLYTTVKGSRELVSKANGVLVFPSVIKAGLGVGGEYGEGALRIRNVTEGYYSTASLSVGLQAGAQSKALIFLFMNQDALNRFRNSEGWSVGADASVAVLKVGINGEVDTKQIPAPVQVIALTNAGLMANLTLEGTKVTRMRG